MSERDRLAGKYAEKQRKKRLGTARTYEEFKTSYSDGWDACEANARSKCSDLETKCSDLEKKAEALVSALEVIQKYTFRSPGPAGCDSHGITHPCGKCAGYPNEKWIAKKALADYRSEGEDNE